MSTDEINYKVVVTDQYHKQEFNFSQRVPSTLHQEVSNRSVLVEFMKELTREHHAELVEAYPWRCVECDLPATTLVHQPHSYVHLKEDPFIVDFAAPVCFESSRCIHIIHEEKHHLATEVMKMNIDKNSCGHCNKMPKDKLFKRCSRCKVISYCSRECQVAAWSDHKIWCKKYGSK
jgi:hypothetical protein